MTDYGRRMTHYQLLRCALSSPHARMASLARRVPAVVRGRDARARLLAALGSGRVSRRRGRLAGRPWGDRAGAQLRRWDPLVPRGHPPVLVAVSASERI